MIWFAEEEERARATLRLIRIKGRERSYALKLKSSIINYQDEDERESTGKQIKAKRVSGTMRTMRASAELELQRAKNLVGCIVNNANRRVAMVVVYCVLAVSTRREPDKESRTWQRATIAIPSIPTGLTIESASITETSLILQIPIYPREDACTPTPFHRCRRARAIVIDLLFCSALAPRGACVRPIGRYPASFRSYA